MPDSYFAHETAVIDAGAEIGEGTSIWHFCHISGGSRIGQDCTLGQNVYVGPGVRIGNRVKIQNNVSVFEGVALEDEVFCGPGVVFTNVKNPRSGFPTSQADYGRTLVKRGATLGANCTVVCGIEVSEWAFVAAGAVVNKNVVPYALMAGVPAKRIGWVSAAGVRLLFEGGEAICEATGQRYTLTEGRVQEI